MSTPRAAVSAVLITRNAENVLEACLESLAFADEIVVVDSASGDATVQIATRRGARVVQKEWLGFGRQKQFAVEQARNDWVLCLDADERVSPELAASIEAALAAPVSPVYRMARRNRFLGRWLAHGEGYPDWSPRLFNRMNARWSDDLVHEKVLFAVTPGTLQGDLMHDSTDDLTRYLERQNRYTTLAARQAYERGVTAGALHLLLSPVVRGGTNVALACDFAELGSGAKPPDPPPPAPPKGKSPAGWIVLGAGAAIGLGTFAVDAFVLKPKVDDFDAQRTAGDPAALETQKSIATTKTFLFVGYGVAVVTMVVGATILLWPSKSTAVAPVVRRLHSRKKPTPWTSMTSDAGVFFRISPSSWSYIG